MCSHNLVLGQDSVQGIAVVVHFNRHLVYLGKDLKEHCPQHPQPAESWTRIQDASGSTGDERCVNAPDRLFLQA